MKPFGFKAFTRQSNSPQASRPEYEVISVIPLRPHFRSYESVLALLVEPRQDLSTSNRKTECGTSLVPDSIEVEPPGIKGIVS